MILLAETSDVLSQEMEMRTHCVVLEKVHSPLPCQEGLLVIPRVNRGSLLPNN